MLSGRIEQRQGAHYSTFLLSARDLVSARATYVFRCGSNDASFLIKACPHSVCNKAFGHPPIRRRRAALEPTRTLKTTAPPLEPRSHSTHRVATTTVRVLCVRVLLPPRQGHDDNGSSARRDPR